MGEQSDLIDARQRLVNAIHAMHVDQRIIVDSALANELEMAWDNYDTESQRSAASREVSA